eukprot:scaffold4006_cov343-Prasinococcus_capsulatus_cf.AAC.3
MAAGKPVIACDSGGPVCRALWRWWRRFPSVNRPDLPFAPCAEGERGAWKDGLALPSHSDGLRECYA